MKIKNTKIVATIGPSSWDYESLQKLAKAGMDIARLNFSHGTHEEKIRQIENIRKISKELNKPLAIIADLAGPKLRLGDFETINLKSGQVVQLSSNPVSGEIPLQFNLSPYLKKGQRILLNDGLVELKVLEIKGAAIVCKVQNDGEISSHKGVNVPDTHLPATSLTEKDLEDGQVALKNKVDFLALSFVQKAEDLKKGRELIKKYHPQAKIIVKLEKPQALKNLEEILKATDAVMVARGDLAIETEATSVPLLQKQIIRLARQYFKPVIVATQMLESMTENPRPTRAEVSDVANAIFDQADCVMLSAETASGKYPVEAVETMAEIILSVQSHEEYQNFVGVDMTKINSKEISGRAIAASAALLSDLVKAKLIVVGTETGASAHSLSIFRPPSTVVALTHNEVTRNQLVLYWGITPFLISVAKNVNEFWDVAVKIIRSNQLVKAGDKIVVVNGSKMNMPGNTDNIKLLTI